MDLYTRMIVGWSMDARMTRELVINALRMGYFRRKPKPGVMRRSDRGSQYCSDDYQALLRDTACSPRCRAGAIAGTTRRWRASSTA
jgi:putative transposase